MEIALACAVLYVIVLPCLSVPQECRVFDEWAGMERIVWVEVGVWVVLSVGLRLWDDAARSSANLACNFCCIAEVEMEPGMGEAEGIMVGRVSI